MTPEDARKLIGGYATGNLGDEEQKALFAAALSDQELFDELVKEQALKELLDDPQSRKHVLDQLRPSREKNVAWRWAAAGSLALATVMIAVVMLRVPDRPQSAPVLTATRLPAPAAPSPMAAPVVPSPALRDSVQRMAREPAQKAENKTSAAAPVAVLSEQRVDEVAKPKAMAQAVNAGLQFRILRREANGIFTEAASDTVFDAGDAVRVRVEPPAVGILSLSAGTELLASIPVEANQTYVLPPDRPIVLDGPPGETRWTLTLSLRAERLAMRQKKAEDSSAVSGGALAHRSVEIVLRHR